MSRVRARVSVWLVVCLINKLTSGIAINSPGSIDDGHIAPSRRGTRGPRLGACAKPVTSPRPGPGGKLAGNFTTSVRRVLIEQYKLRHTFELMVKQPLEHGLALILEDA